MAKAIEAGMPKLPHRGGRGPHPGAHRLGPAGVVGVNRYRPDGAETIDVLKVDNTAVRERPARQAGAPAGRARPGRGRARRSTR